MSKTDKDRPYWVQLRDPGFPWSIRETHMCHRRWGMASQHECDLDFPLPRIRWQGWRACEYWPRYRDYDKIYGRPRYRRSFGSFQDGRARADLRRLKAKWLREPVTDDIDSTENMPTSRWRWRRWYWD